MHKPSILIIIGDFSGGQVGILIILMRVTGVIVPLVLVLEEVKFE